MTRVKIKVTEEHIKAGKRGDCNACPIALAVLDAVMVPAVRANMFGLSLICSDRGYPDNEYISHANYTPKVARFISDFDRGNHVKPFTFYAEFTDA